MRQPRLPAILLLAFALALSCKRGPAPAADQPVAHQRPALIGVWRVVRFCEDDSLGHLTEPLGPTPGGYFIYAPSGQLSIQLMRTPGPKPFQSGDDFLPSAAEAQALLTHDYFGYYGTYTITSDSTVTHHVTGGTVPSFIGTDQLRVYRVRGDSLTIGGSPTTWPCRLMIREG